MNPLVSFPEAGAYLHPPLFAAAFEACPESLAIIEKARIRYANPAFARLFGYTRPEELSEKLLADFLPEDRVCAHADFAERRPDGSSLCGYPACRFQGKHRNGSRVAMEACCSRFYSGDHSLLLIAAHDVSQPERRRVVRESERRFRTIFDAAAIGICHCTLSERIVESNRALERMLGYGHEELRGRRLHDFLHPEDLPSLPLFQEMLAGIRDHCQMETRYLRKDRNQGWARLTVSLVRGPDGQPEFAIAMVEDITERKRAEQELHEAHKMEAIGRLVGGVAHDFNNLLTGTMLYCDLLLSGLPAGSRLRHYAEEIRLASEHGAALVQQLLAVARQQVVQPGVLSLNEVLASMRNLLARLIGENIELVTNLAPGLGSVKMDPAQAQQIVLNLVLNARDAMPDGGRVTLETRNCETAADEAGPRPSVLITVKDTGCGMDVDTLAHLFEPFFTTKQARGNGLGLTTVHSAVTQCGGEIQVQSEPGKGTTVSIRLPRVEGEPHGEAEAAGTEPLSGRETILLVEDDPAVRGSMQRLLCAGGYRVLEAAAGPEALKICRSHEGEIHLLLADVVMPGMSGRQVAHQACTLRAGMRVLYISGYSHAAAEDFNREPVVLFRKPFTGSALLRKVREALASTQAQKPDRRKR